MSRYRPMADDRTDPVTALYLEVDDRAQVGDPVPCTNDLDFIEEHPAAWERAKVWCSYCPILDACRRAAAAMKPEAGVWAGKAYGRAARAPKPRATGFKVPPTIEVTCDWCGVTVMGYPRQRFCTNACKSADRRDRERRAS